MNTTSLCENISSSAICDEYNSQTYYLPHHPVFKEASTTTKIRVVFDGSAKTSSGFSLYEALCVGPVVQDDLLTIILRFRTYPIALVGDIAKMYRQVLIHPDDSALQRILWRFSDQTPVQTYELLTVTYGLGPSSYLATRTLQQLTEDDGISYALAGAAIKKCFYVDDFIGGAQTIEETIRLRTELSDLLHKGGFTLRKWISNQLEVLQGLPNDGIGTQSALHFSPNKTIKALGISWEPETDHLRFDSQIRCSNEPPTKRTILSDISKLFDPLGLIAPVVVRAKILMQELWLLSCGWDDPVPEPIKTKWDSHSQMHPYLHTVPAHTSAVKPPISPEVIVGRTLTVNELAKSKTFLIRLAQNDEIVAEINQLDKNKSVSKRSHIRQMTPFLDAERVLRVGGRLNFAQLPYQAKHPALIPTNHPFTRLIVEDFHRKLLHGGGRLLLTAIREEFWPLNGRRLVRNVVRNCFRCTRLNPVPAQQQIGQLPVSRVIPSRPFSVTGVDYAGPLYLRPIHKRVAPAKAYLCVFVCFSTKSVHLELVSDLSTQAFLCSLRRFIARRGRPAHIHSDNGKNFEGAKNDLTELFTMLKDRSQQDEIAAFCTEEGMTWHLTPPKAPHFGGSR
ncbi:uncharacterized protein LOC131428867 [Malaya genurostris]|uniref:uncharacterized protein LOC131428867 n=1 Tax=Malaya genurostris TaxID=325434 RepID=UPI0026F3A678|nr:uncharacterized protein LOC131428867 [Malaya genurostris]